MFDIGILLKQAGKVAAKNSPAILTGLGVTGVVTTAVLAAKGAFKSAGDIREEEAELAFKVEDEEITVEEAQLTTKDKFDLTWKNYVPAFATGAVTIAAIICSHNIADRRAAAAAAAYTFVEKSYKDYQSKTKEKIGEKKEREVRDEIAQDLISKNPPSPQFMFVEGLVPCKDEISGRYFNTTMELLRKAQNDLNYKIINEDEASVSELYDLLGLDHTTGSDDMGWRSKVEFDIPTSLTPDNRPCFVLRLPSPRPLISQY